MKRASRGVTLYALSFIIFSIFRLIGIPSIPMGYDTTPPLNLTAIMIYGLISNVGLIIAGINIFKLKEWARKLALWLTIVGTLYMSLISVNLTWDSIKRIPDDPKYADQFNSAYASLKTGRPEGIPEAAYKVGDKYKQYVKKTEEIYGEGNLPRAFAPQQGPASQEQFNTEVMNRIYGFASLGMMISLVYLISVIFFFTRRKVKAQFE